MRVIMLLIGMGITGCVIPAPAQTQTTNVNVSAEQRMVNEINEYRARYNLPPLRPDPFLCNVAQTRVAYFHHKHPRYGWVWEHAHKRGYPGHKHCTDNLCQGDISPEDAVDGWATSSVGHNMQMRGYRKINGKWHNFHPTKVGVAVKGRNYIAIFGQ